ncbi:phosphodiesterase [bacterium BMS3Bbin11]|nr:phosphodiesterase [bacterium BMS3Abin11]GBE46570.1 phosphodiesterase [bacterium BMS3Bbin11]GMT40904.1 MAG: phosphodiesterase [bacterium]HDH09027.1 metallophosphoesterase [Gammaproteobacteria bacterium]HDO23108.1 metallophosphoesterase [Nitrospirota bacterium]
MKVLILSDIHANYPALKSVLDKDGDYDLLLFLGDVVDYGPNPEECLDFIKNNADYCVRGNHDHAMGYNTDCHSMGSFREFSIETRRWHRTLLSDDDISFLRNMPLTNTLYIEGESCFMAHASPQGDMAKYLTVEEMTKELKNILTKYVLVGHTHIQYQKKLADSLIINPGSVGLARDSSKACYAVYENNIFTLKKVDYDTDKTISDLMESPVSQSCKDGLRKILLHT